MEQGPWFRDDDNTEIDCDLGCGRISYPTILVTSVRKQSYMRHLSRPWSFWRATCPYKWWWPCWHGWHKGWRPRTTRRGTPQPPPAEPRVPSSGTWIADIGCERVISIGAACNRNQKKWKSLFAIPLVKCFSQHKNKFCQELWATLLKVSKIPIRYISNWIYFN